MEMAGMYMFFFLDGVRNGPMQDSSGRFDIFEIELILISYFTINIPLYRDVFLASLCIVIIALYVYRFIDI